MKQLRNLTLAVAFLMTPFVVNAQNTSDESNGFRSFSFVQAQGGLHLPFTPGSRSDLMKPNFGFNIGHWFAPVIGARIGAEGLQSTVFYNDKYEEFKYLNFDIDGMFNLSPLFVHGNNPKLNVYLLGGVGLNYLTDKGNITRSTKSNFAHNLRVGVGLEYRIAKPLSLSLEYRMNNTTDYFNGRENSADDWFSSLLLGLSFNFGYSKKVWDDGRLVEKQPTTLNEKKELAVNERMNTWVKRMKGESKADYLARTSDEAIETQRLAFGREFATATALASNQAIVSGNARYNEGSQALVIDPSDNMPSIVLSVPKADAEKLDVSNLRFENTKYDITADNQFEVIYTEAINVKTGERYIYNKTDAKIEDETGFMSLADYQLKQQQGQIIASNTAALTAQTNAVQEMKEKKYHLKNTDISAVYAGNTLSYKYTVKDEFSVNDDFAAGQYEAENNAASKAMLSAISKSISEDFAKYFEAGKTVEIRYRGTADAKPINGKIAYNGKYGDIKEQPVTINGKEGKLSVTKAEGITSNEQLSLLRAISVQKYIRKNISALKDMKVTESFNVEVAPTEGSQYRRVAVDFIFNEASK